MTYVIAQPCVDLLDRACVDECPVDCIYEGERMLYIHPDECVDCGACEPVCPVEAIFYEDDTPDSGKTSTRPTSSSSTISARRVAQPRSARSRRTTRSLPPCRRRSPKNRGRAQPRDRAAVSCTAPRFPWDRLEPAKAVAAAHPDGLVDLSVGTPVDPVPDVVQEALAGGVQRSRLSDGARDPSSCGRQPSTG